MKRLLFLLIMLLMAGMVAGPVMAQGAFGPAGPFDGAPNAGDGDPDGSGFNHTYDDPDNDPYGRNGGNGKQESNDSKGTMGPAPNAGDGVPDGSGF